jgi:hypothetical protein
LENLGVNGRIILKLKWEDNIKIDVQVVGWADIDWIDLALDRFRALVHSVMNHYVQ